MPIPATQILFDPLNRHLRPAHNSPTDLSPRAPRSWKLPGYHVSWLSNQNRLGGWDSPTTVIANEADHQVWINETIGEKIQSRHYDDTLVDELRKIPLNNLGT